MISYLSGTIQEKDEKNLTLNVNGVGYLVAAAKNLLEKLQYGELIELYIHTHVREDAISLYGFQTKEELQFFELLLTVSGVGPKSALEMLNSPISKTRQAIASKNAAYLTQIPGIGKKTAERIIVDLQGKIKEDILLEENEEQNVANEDIVRALIALGYHRQQVTQGLQKIPSEITGEEAIIKHFLQNN